MPAKPYASKEEEEEARIRGAKRLLEQWGGKYGGELSGSIRVQHQTLEPGRNEVSPMQTMHVGPRDAPSMTRLPRNFTLDDASKMFDERDRLKAKASDDGKSIDPASVTAAAIAHTQSGERTPIRVLKYRWLHRLYRLITKEVP